MALVKISRPGASWRGVLALFLWLLPNLAFGQKVIVIPAPVSMENSHWSIAIKIYNCDGTFAGLSSDQLFFENGIMYAYLLDDGTYNLKGPYTEEPTKNGVEWKADLYAANCSPPGCVSYVVLHFTGTRYGPLIRGNTVYGVTYDPTICLSKSEFGGIRLP